MIKSDQKWLIRMLLTMTIVLSILLLFFLRQNLKLKNYIINKERNEKKKLTLKHEYNLEDYFLFKKFPININIEDFYFNDQNNSEFTNGYIVMISDLTVCGKCLNKELEVMNTFKEKAKEINLVFLGIIGLSDQKEEAEIINRYKTGEIFFPCKTVSVESLYQTFKLNREYFLDTPFYFYLSHSFITLDIFKPLLMDQKEMIRWLTIITDQDGL